MTWLPQHVVFPPRYHLTRPKVEYKKNQHTETVLYWLMYWYKRVKGRESRSYLWSFNSWTCYWVFFVLCTFVPATCFHQNLHSIQQYTSSHTRWFWWMLAGCIGNNKHVEILSFQDQYQFVHDVVKEYILQNETYSNFANGWNIKQRALNHNTTYKHSSFSDCL